MNPRREELSTSNGLYSGCQTAYHTPDLCSIHYREDGVRQAEMDAPQNLSKAERLLATGRMPASRAAAAILVKASCDTG